MRGGIGELIKSMLGGRTYKQLSEDCGGAPTIGRISGIVSDGITGFPTMTTIEGLAKGLGVNRQTIVQACGVELGLWEPSAFLNTTLPLPDGAQDLSAGQRNAIVAVVREFISCNTMANAA